MVIGLSLTGVFNTIALMYLGEIENDNFKAVGAVFLVAAATNFIWSARNILLDKEDRIRQHNWR